MVFTFYFGNQDGFNPCEIFTFIFKSFQYKKSMILCGMTNLLCIKYQAFGYGCLQSFQAIPLNET